MAAITAAAMRRRVLNMVYSSQPTFRPFQTPMATAGINASVTTIDVPTGTGGGWAAGDEGEFEDGERYLVTAVATDAKTVIRGHAGTTATTHAQYDIITKNPRFTVAAIDQYILDSVLDLSPDIYNFHTITDTYTAGTEWYEMDATGDENIYEVMTVYVKMTNESHPTPVSGWVFVNNVDSTGFTEPNGLYIPGGLNIKTASSFYIACRKAYTVITDLDAASPAVRVVAHFVAYKLLGGAEIARSHDPGKRTDRTVQPGTEGRSSIWHLREAERLRMREEARLDSIEDRLPKDRYAMRARRYRV